MAFANNTEDAFGFDQALPEYTIVKRAILHSFYEADDYLKSYSATGSEDQLINFISATLSLYRKLRSKIPYISKINKTSKKEKEKELWKQLYVLDSYLLESISDLIKKSGSDKKQQVCEEIIKCYLLMSNALEELGISKITTETVSPDYALSEGAY